MYEMALIFVLRVWGLVFWGWREHFLYWVLGFGVLSRDQPQDQLISDSILWNHDTNNQVEVCVFVNYVKKLVACINQHVGMLVCTVGFIKIA